MKKSQESMQCDFCELLIYHKVNDKELINHSYYETKIIRKNFNGKDELLGLYCTIECLFQNTILKIPLTSYPTFKDRKDALQKMILFLEEEQNAIFNKHNRMSECIDKKNDLEKQEKEIGDINIKNILG